MSRIVCSVFVVLATPAAAALSDFPARPARIIVNFASGTIGVERAMKATPDGYTILLSGSSPLVINPSLPEKPALDTVCDLALTKTPAMLTRRINQKLRKVIAAADVRTRFTELGMEPVGNSEQEFARVIQSDLIKWAKVIQAAGVKAE